MESSSKPENSKTKSGIASAEGRPEYLASRGDTWYFKRKVPKGFEDAFPESSSGTVWRSLRTKDYDEACERLREHVLDFEKALRTFKKKTGPSCAKPSENGGTERYLIPEHIPIILQRYEHSMLVQDDDERSEIGEETRGNPHEREQRIAERRELLARQLADYKSAAAVRESDIVEELASDILHVDRLVAPPGSLVREAFVDDLLRLEVKLLNEQLSRLDGEGGKTPPASEYPLAPRDLATLRDALDAWKKSQSRDKTIHTYERFVDEFESVVERVPLIALGREHVYQYREWLEGSGIRRDTAKNRIGGLATLFEYAAAEGLGQEQFHGKANPFSGLRLDAFADTASHEERRPYREDELQKLFSSELYRGEYVPQGQTAEALYWSPLIGAFSGGRLEEIAQLRTANIQRIQGTWALELWEREPGQRLKTKSSFRRVPVHQELIKCGFIAYAQKQDPSGLLFPSLRNENKYESWSAALSSSFARYMDRAGLNDKRLDFHSFRYSFRQQCANCGIGTEVRDALTGHWDGDREAGRTYLKDSDRQYPWPALVAAMAQFKYSGLDLSHLHT